MTKVLVATHKQATMPQGAHYLPIQVGAKLSATELGLVRDDSGTNISHKNQSYCELTGVYWAWKNLDAPVIGLAHYRRLFVEPGFNPVGKIPISNTTITTLLEEYDVLLPKKRHYWVETNYSHYIHAHKKEPLDVMREVIADAHPKYLPALDLVFNRRSAHMFNMFIMKQEFFESYCQFMFDVLERVEERIDITTFDPVEKRVFGYLSELLMDIWLETEKPRYKEISYRFTEKQNWPKKIWHFALRKIESQPK